QQQRLLQPSSRAGKVKRHMVFFVSHDDFTTFGVVLRREKLDAEEFPDSLRNIRPTAFLPLPVDLPAEVPQYLRGLALANEETDFSGFLDEFPIRQSRHWWKK